MAAQLITVATSMHLMYKHGRNKAMKCELNYDDQNFQKTAI